MRRSTRLVAALVAALVAGMATPFAQPSAPVSQGRGLAARAFDARAAFRPPRPSTPSADQLAALQALQASLPALRAELDAFTGATRSLWNVGGFLTAPDARDPAAIAADFIAAHVLVLGLEPADIVDYALTDRVYSSVSGVTHLYYQQQLGGVPVYNAQLHVNVAADGRVLSVNNQFVPHLASTVRTLRPAQGAEVAVSRVAALHGRGAVTVNATASDRSARRMTAIEADGLSAEPIRAGLVLLPLGRGAARLAWNFQVHAPDEGHAFDYTVDAETGLVWTRVDWVAADQYLVYPQPIESPSHASPAPPADARALAVNPAHNIASPFGWHDDDGVAGADHTTTRGNNVRAYADPNDADPALGAAGPDCGASLDCSFTLDLTQPPSAYQAAAVANVFYWSNLVHDIQHRYGFDEAAGNFQERNYTGQGLGGDSVRAEAQDSAALPPTSLTRNNAFFMTPPDGQRPRMELMPWSYTSPERDGSLDAGIIVHEYAHGISNRLVGGPSNVNCLANLQQPGEGISDWLALVYTARPSDTAAQPRGIGTYGRGEAPDGPGIRSQRYSTDPTVNTWTYASIADPNLSAPHGVGSVWAQGMWEVYWALVDEYGFSSNLYDANGGAGNQRAMLYHNEGLKHTACSPTFTDVRDGILQAAQVINGGADVCRLWDAFAAFGLGIDAVSGGAGSRDVRNGFNKPVACGGQPIPGVSVGDISVVEGDSGITDAVFTVSLSNTTPTPVAVDYRTANGTARGDVVTTSRSNPTSIQIPDDIGTTGPVTPYPSTVTVPPDSGTVQAVAVALHGFGHTFPEDVDVLLQGPNGQTVLLMSDVGGEMAVNGVTLTFRDDAPSGVPTTHLASGSYRPTNVDTTTDFFAAPAPAAPYGSRLGVFVGQPAAGTWRLFVSDDFSGEGGAIAGGWTLYLGTAGNDFAISGGTLTIPAGETSATITVPVFGDLLPEGPETFRLLLSSPLAAVLADAEGVATILDDDDPDVLPEPPTAVRVANVSGNAVTLTWVPPATGAPPTGYVIEGGLNPGEVLASIPTGSAAPGVTFSAPTGSFYVRVHTLWGQFKSSASSEFVLHVNIPAPPAAPAPLLATVDGSSLALAWQTSYEAGTPTGFVLDVTGDLVTTIPLGRTERFQFTGVPNGSYTLQLRAVNAAGSSPATEPIELTFEGPGGPCTGVPETVTNLRAFQVNRVIHVRWDLPAVGPAPTSYVVQVSGAYTGGFGSVARELSGAAAPGEYGIQVVGVNACGAGTPTSSIPVVVP